MSKYVKVNSKQGSRCEDANKVRKFSRISYFFEFYLKIVM